MIPLVHPCVCRLPHCFHSDGSLTALSTGICWGADRYHVQGKKHELHQAILPCGFNNPSPADPTVPRRAPFDEDLHDLISERYERTTTVVTSNLDYEEWDQAFAVNRLLGSATLDRLRHNAYCLELDGPSFRAPQLLPK